MTIWSRQLGVEVMVDLLLRFVIGGISFEERILKPRGEDKKSPVFCLSLNY